jgi:hypothetical protein
MASKGFNFDLLNWKLPNVILGMIYGFPDYLIATNRNLKYKTKPDWWLGGFSKEIHDPALLAAIAEEVSVAKTNGSQVDEQKLADWIKWKQSLRTWNDVRIMERIKP